MNRVLIWKTLRDQWVAWLAVAIAQTVAVLYFNRLLDNPYRAERLIGALRIAAWGYGMICGALSLAGETEAGTQAFLDTLSPKRMKLWLRIVSTGLFLVAAQVMVLYGIGLAGLRQDAPPSRENVGWAGLFCFSAVGYAWGLFCGSFSPSDLCALCRAALFQAVTLLCLWGLSLFPLEAFERSTRSFSHFSSLAVATVTESFPQSSHVPIMAVSAAAMVWSAWIYCRIDRLREAVERDASGDVPSTSLLEVIWPAARQARGFALVMGFTSLFATFAALLAGERNGQVWMVGVGALSAVAGFVGGRPKEAWHSCTDLPLPAELFWLVTTSVRFGVLAAATIAASALAASLTPALKALSLLGVSPATFPPMLPRPPLAHLGDFVELLIYALMFGYAVGTLGGLLFVRIGPSWLNRATRTQSLQTLPSSGGGNGCPT